MLHRAVLCRDRWKTREHSRSSFQPPSTFLHGIPVTLRQTVTLLQRRYLSGFSLQHLYLLDAEVNYAFSLQRQIQWGYDGSWCCYLKSCKSCPWLTWRALLQHSGSWLLPLPTEQLERLWNICRCVYLCAKKNQNINILVSFPFLPLKPSFML